MISVGSPGVSSVGDVLPVAVARAQDAVAQRAGRAVREDVHERAGEVGVARARSAIQSVSASGPVTSTSAASGGVV